MWWTYLEEQAVHLTISLKHLHQLWLHLWATVVRSPGRQTTTHSHVASNIANGQDTAWAVGTVRGVKVHLAVDTDSQAAEPIAVTNPKLNWV